MFYAEFMSPDQISRYLWPPSNRKPNVGILPMQSPLYCFAFNKT